MKKQNFLKIIYAGLLLSLGLASCSKCQTCTYTYGSTSYSEEVCQSEFADNKSLFKAYITYLESVGYKCK